MAAVVRQTAAVANELLAVSLFWPAFLSVPSARMNVRTSNSRIGGQWHGAPVRYVRIRLLPEAQA
jgi:hypothetical protein